MIKRLGLTKMSTKEQLPIITIEKSEIADSRTCDWSKVSKEQLLSSSKQHISDVGQCINFFKVMLNKASKNHDFDKVSDIDGFYSNFKTGFKERKWLDNHTKVNRHHIMNPDGVVPEDVNLIDVLEAVADCVIAGMARTGSVYDLEIEKEVLDKAFKNTVELLKKHIKVK